MKRNVLLTILYLMAFTVLLTACGKKKSTSGVYYEVIDGKIVEIREDSSEEKVPDNAGDFSAPRPVLLPQETVNQEASTEADYFAAGEYSPSVVSDGTAVFPDEEYNSLSAADSVKTESLKKELNAAADAVRGIYDAADKGNTYNVTLSDAAVSQMVQVLGNAGFSATDSERNCTMSNWEPIADFGENIPFGQNISATYYIVYPDGHMSLFHLYREAKQWHLISMSMAWNDDLSARIFSEGRYAVGSVSYTGRGWLIYSRNTSDFDDNQKANTGSYTMVRILPYDATARELCRKYVEPVGYFENNLFISDWNEQNFSALDFNSLYPYTFQISNGTSEMLSAYNVRNYYKLYPGSNLYLIPAKYYEENTLKRFNISVGTLRALAGYYPEADGYFFLGYDRDYYNVTPRTPFPEVISYAQNNDTTITMMVAAVNPWYGTDCAFVHTLTVRPEADGSYKYVSNYLTPSDMNILPEQKIAARRAVELADMKEKGIIH